VNPGVELKAISSRLAALDASATLAADPTDKHQLVVTLAPNYNAALVTLYNQDITSKLRRIENAIRFVPLQ
jgi:hypothetical protein